MNETKQTELRMRPRRTELAASKPDIEWVKTPKKHWQERLLPNLAIASALMLCAVALKTGAIPPLTDAVQSVMSAATDDSLLNGDLGKLSFVSSIFPEASLVFGESGGKLTMPVEAASVVHAWSQSEPFISWDAQTKIVTSAMAGEVIGVYHGNEDERLVRRETVRSLSVAGVRDLKGAVLSTRGPGWTHLWCTCCRANGIAG